MLMLLLAVIGISLTFSFLCSLMEAALLTVPLSYAQSMADQNSRSGKQLLKFKRDLSAPISAILILNTVSHTVGATVSGAMVDDIYGDRMLAWFSVLFTLMILYLSEIIPKQIGVMFHKSLSIWFVLPLQWMVLALYPLILTTNWVSSWIGRKTQEPSVSVQELLAMAKVGKEEQVLDSLESSVIKNIILLDRVCARDIATPRPVVLKLPESTRLGEIRNTIAEWNHTRIPLVSESDPDRVAGYVNQRDLLLKLMEGNDDLPVSHLMRNLGVVPDTIPIDRLLEKLVNSREPIRAVVDEYGVFVGLVTLEDVIEEIFGKEIVDEYDIIGNLQTYAKVLFAQRKKQKPESSNQSG